MKNKISISLLFVVFLTTSLFGQSGSIIGTVVDASDDTPLFGTNIFIAGTSNGTASDRDGQYRLANVAAGKQILVFRYIGYQTDSIEVNVVAGKNLELDHEMNFEVFEGKEIVVTAQAQGQVKAINEQLSSNTIVNVVSKDKIEELPDANVAESIGRLPGISLQRDAGEGSKIVVRGLSPRFNSITVNGERIPATDPSDRSVDLSMISQDVLSGIEVFKALTPDKDADAIGGTINLVTKTAPKDFQLSILAQGGYNDHESDFGQYKSSISASNRFFNDKIGVLATASAQRANRSSDLLNATYTDDGAEIPVISVASLNLVDRIETRDRYSAGLNLDYMFDNGSIRFNNLYTRTEREELRRRKRYRVEEFRVEYDLREREINVDLFSSSVIGNFDFSSLNMDFQVSYSNSKQNTPYLIYGRFQEIGAYSNGLKTTLGPKVIPQYALNDLSQTWFQYGTSESEDVDDRDFTAQINSKYPFNFANCIAGYLKGGLKFRDKNRDKNTTIYRTDFGVTDIIGQANSDKFDLVEGHILISDFINQGFEADNFLDGQYEFGIGLDASSIAQFYNNYKSYYELQRSASLANYEASESIYAGYLMSEINIGNNLMILPGFRYEKTDNKYTGYVGRLRGNLGQRGVISDSVGTQEYEEWLPMVHVKYTLLNGFDIRLAYTESIGRPNYFNLVPYENISDPDLTVSRGNPSLNHTTAKNYDVHLSLYNNYGLFTVSGFYKDLKNIDYLFTYRETEGKYANYTITEPINSPDAKVYGFEVDMQTNLRFLPFPFDGIVISLNYSRIESETGFPYFEIGERSTTYPYNIKIIKGFRDGRMPGQADKIINLVLGYELGNFMGRVSLLHQGEIISSVGQRSEFDTHIDDFTRIDMSLSQKFEENLSVFLNINNLTNLAEGSYYGVENRPVDQQYFGWTADFGVRYRLK